MKATRDSLVRLRQMSCDQAAAEMARATHEVNGARALLDAKKTAAGSIEDRRSTIADHLHYRHDARWFAHHWAFDRLLAEDLERAREEAGRAEGELNGSIKHLRLQKKNLAAAQARLRAAHSLRKRRRRASGRRRERRAEEDVSGICTRCL